MDGRGNRKQGTLGKLKATQENSIGGGKHHFLFMVLFIYVDPSTLAIEGKPGRTSCQQSNTPCGRIQMFVLPATRIKTKERRRTRTGLKIMLDSSHAERAYWVMWAGVSSN